MRGLAIEADVTDDMAATVREGVPRTSALPGKSPRQTQHSLAATTPPKFHLPADDKGITCTQMHNDMNQTDQQLFFGISIYSCVLSICTVLSVEV